MVLDSFADFVFQMINTTLKRKSLSIIDHQENLAVKMALLATGAKAHSVLSPPPQQTDG